MVKRYALILAALFLTPQAHSMAALSSVWSRVASIAAPVAARIGNSFSAQSITSKLTQLADSRFAGYCTLSAMACASIVGTYVLAKKLFGTSDYSNTKSTQKRPTRAATKFAQDFAKKYPDIMLPQTKTKPYEPVTSSHTSEIPATQPVITVEQPRAAQFHNVAQDRAIPQAVEIVVHTHITPEPSAQHNHVEPREFKAAQAAAAAAAAPIITVEPKAIEPSQQLNNNPYLNDNANLVWHGTKFTDAHGNQNLVVQLNVSPQGKKNGGIGSCAFHAVLKANPTIALLAQGQLKPETAKKILQQDKMDFRTAKAFIINLRRKIVLTEYYKIMLTRAPINNLRAQQDEVIYTIYDNLLHQTIDSMQEAQIRTLDIIDLKPVVTAEAIAKVEPGKLALFAENSRTEQFIDLMNEPRTWTRYMQIKQKKIVTSIYSKLLNTFINNATTGIISGSTPTKTLTPAEIVQTIAELPIVATVQDLIWFNQNIDTLTALIGDAETMRQNIALDRPLELSRDHITTAWREYNLLHPASPMNETGEWLNEGEITALVNHELSKPESLIARAYSKANVKVCTIESPEQHILETNETIIELRSAIQEQRMPQHRYYAFHLGNMQQAAARAGHFTSAFLEVAPRQLRWITTNSAHNGIQLFGDTSTTQLIKGIVGGESRHDKFEPTPELLAHNEDVLRKALSDVQQEIDEGASRSAFVGNSFGYKKLVESRLKKLTQAADNFDTFNKDYSQFGGSKKTFAERIANLHVRAADLN